jgi:mRNA-degrading endonuclease toxin of MazEF toxin-antitoxin module
VKVPIRRGTIWNLAGEDERHPVVVVTRDSLIGVLSNVCVAFVTSRSRDVETQVQLGHENGLWEGCSVNALNLLTVPKSELAAFRGELSIEQLRRLDRGLALALEID